MIRITRRRAILVASVIAILVHLPALRNDFAYDDVGVIVNDPRVHGLDSIPAIFSGGYWRSDPDLALWRPLTTLSFALDWQLSGGKSAWFHFTNLLWHSLATGLATALLAGFATPAAALLGGALFAVHPVHVEAVANVVGRAELIAAACCFAALLLWRPPTHRPVRTAGIVGLFVAALLAKESAIVLPALLLLLDIGTGALRSGAAVPWLRQRWRSVALLTLSGGTVLVVRAVLLGRTLPARVDPVLEVTPDFLPRLFTTLQVWPHVLRLFFLPATLLADYSARVIMPAHTPTLLTWAGVVIWLGLVAGGIAAARAGRGPVALALLWVPAALLPVSNFLFPVGVLLAERTLYLPSFALALGVTLAGAGMFARARPGIIIAAAVTCAVLALRTLTRIPEWRSTDAVMVALLRDRPDAFRAHWHIARTAVARGDAPRALEEYAAALRLWPYRRGLVLEAARVANRFGDRAFARQIIEHGASTWPDDVDIVRMAAGTALDMADTAAARAHVAAGLRLRAADPVLLQMNQAITTP